ncbi:MAG: transporter, family, galactose:H+ symporter [Solirubrobacterales bacterium]|jgi:sugar porter (SP) family MFS transporter|nr:transporter, family, galactose:H+ symporter [Solirubrobacterales bacterium]
MAGSLLTRRLADALGRRRTLLLDAAVFVAGTALAIVAPNYTVLLVARAVAGVAVGIASSTVPLYLAEIAPAAVRGRLVTTQQLMITLGILASYCVDLALATSGSWRAAFGVGLLPAAMFVLAMLRAPETPAWLYAHGQSEHARSVALQVADPEETENLLQGADEPATDLRSVLRSGTRPALIVGVTLAAMQQLSGINAILYFAPSIMERTGVSVSQSILYSVIVGAVNVAATIVSFRLVDRLGRRPLLLGSLGAMAVSLACLGLTLRLGSAYSSLSLVFMLTYIVAFAVGFGPIFWLLVAEIFPPRTRAAGASVSTATNWLSNFLVGLSFLPVVGLIGVGATFWLFASASAFTFAFVACYLPETKGRTFAQIQGDLRARWYTGAFSGTRTSPG